MVVVLTILVGLASFEHHWTTASGEVLLGDAYFPHLQPAGNTVVQSFASMPEAGNQSIGLMYLLALHAARSSIDMEASYFIPDAHTMRALLAAPGRGVRVRLVVPGPEMDRVMGHASQELWGAPLAASARISRFQGATLHSKLLIIDDF